MLIIRAMTISGQSVEKEEVILIDLIFSLTGPFLISQSSVGNDSCCIDLHDTNHRYILPYPYEFVASHILRPRESTDTIIDLIEASIRERETDPVLEKQMKRALADYDLVFKKAEGKPQ